MSQGLIIKKDKISMSMTLLIDAIITPALNEARYRRRGVIGIAKTKQRNKKDRVFQFPHVLET